MKIDWKRKFSSRKFWSLLAALVVSCLTAFGAEHLAAQITGVITAVGACVVYMLAEGMADSAGAGSETTIISSVPKKKD